jgi:hypothetical protein
VTQFAGTEARSCDNARDRVQSLSKELRDCGDRRRADLGDEYVLVNPSGQQLSPINL